MTKPSRSSPPKRPVRLVVLAGALVVGLGLDLSPVGTWIERAVWPMRFAAAPRAPGGRIAIVEMDAASVAKLHQWPWPREHHAAVVDQLRRAGAASITFDIDFSSPSTPASDRAFAAALDRADGLVTLATFAQAAGTGDARSIDALPVPAFRAHTSLASVSVAPDSDGIVRRAPYGTITANTPRPSLGAWIARRSGRADTSFPIDFGIDAPAIPRLSFVVVRDGRFDPARVRGHDILIGATAVEMGDRYATPRWGVIPGVVIQALAAETLANGIPGEGSSLPLVAIALLVGAAVLRLRRISHAMAVAIAGPVALFAAAEVARGSWSSWMTLTPALAALGVVVLGRGAIELATRFDHQRSTDDATGLPNRLAIMRLLEDHPGAVAVVLLDNLEPLLTVLGEEAERDLMLRLADRLRVASGGATAYRLSDRLLAFALPAQEDARDLPARLRAVLLQPIEVAGRRVDPVVHAGLSDETGTIGDRLTGAIQAAEAAGEAGEFWRHSAVDRDALERSVSLMGELDQALAAGEIEVHYQPKLALAENRITGVEALVRWRHPTRGMVRPDHFIPLAEQTDRIGPLTHFVLDRVVRDMAGWHEAGLMLTAAINVSARLVTDEAFAAAVRETLASSGVDPATLTLEVTESATLADPESAAAALRLYRELGCAISMDDYGTGQSTLSYLQRLPLTELKIDRSFVQHAHENPADALMVRSTIDLAHGLGLKVVAEGIEDAACLEFLRHAGCDMAQGYYIAKPMPCADLELFVAPARAAA